MTTITLDFINGEIEHLNNEAKKAADQAILINGAIQAYRVVLAKLNEADPIPEPEIVDAEIIEQPADVVTE